MSGSVTYTSSASNVVAVDAQGNIMGKSPGDATITAHVGDVTQSFPVKVQQPTAIGVAPAPGTRSGGVTAGSPYHPPPQHPRPHRVDAVFRRAGRAQRLPPLRPPSCRLVARGITAPVSEEHQTRGDVIGHGHEAARNPYRVAGASCAIRRSCVRPGIGRTLALSRWCLHPNRRCPSTLYPSRHCPNRRCPNRHSPTAAAPGPQGSG